jgi:hypothetical protein
VRSFCQPQRVSYPVEVHFGWLLLLTERELLSDWAIQGGLSDPGVDVTDPEVAGAVDSCVRTEKGLFVVVIVGDVVLPLADSPLAPPQPAAKTTAAILQHTVIAVLPL